MKTKFLDTILSFIPKLHSELSNVKVQCIEIEIRHCTFIDRFEKQPYVCEKTKNGLSLAQTSLIMDHYKLFLVDHYVKNYTVIRTKSEKFRQLPDNTWERKRELAWSMPISKKMYDISYAFNIPIHICTEDKVDTVSGKMEESQLERFVYQLEESIFLHLSRRKENQFFDIEIDFTFSMPIDLSVFVSTVEKVVRHGCNLLELLYGPFLFPYTFFKDSMNHVNSILGHPDYRYIIDQIAVKVKPMEWNDLTFNFEKYCITEKIDGIKKLLLITNYKIKESDVDHQLIWLIGGTEYQLIFYGVPPFGTTVKTYLFDCELFENTIWLYDTLISNDHDIRQNKKLIERINVYEDNPLHGPTDYPVSLLLKACLFPTYSIRFKQHVRLNEFKFTRNNTLFKQDGFILTPLDESYHACKKNNLVLKWKETINQTNDFYIKKNDQQWNFYVDTPSGLSLFQGSKNNPFPQNVCDIENSELLISDGVFEVAWTTKPVIVRQRLDKKKPNFSTIALSNWELIFDPIPFSFLTKNENERRSILTMRSLKSSIVSMIFDLGFSSYRVFCSSMDMSTHVKTTKNPYSIHDIMVTDHFDTFRYSLAKYCIVYHHQCISESLKTIQQDDYYIQLFETKSTFNLAILPIDLNCKDFSFSQAIGTGNMYSDEYLNIPHAIENVLKKTRRNYLLLSDSGEIKINIVWEHQLKKTGILKTILNDETNPMIQPLYIDDKVHKVCNLRDRSLAITRKDISYLLLQ